ncbi:MAG: type II toxin-antitoxin system Phd/YefM family antitoxin [bacterium]
MKASIVDLRYKMNEILKALEHHETVQILYHGKIKGIITHPHNNGNKKVKEHPFFGMANKDETSVSEIMDELRGPRHHDMWYGHLYMDTKRK